MNNIKVLDTGIDVSAVLQQLKDHADDWGAQNKLENAGSLLSDKWGFPAVEAGVLQLVMGAVTSPEEFVGDTELCKATPAFNNYSELWKILGSYGFRDISRCGFLSLPVGGSVGSHIDIGTYYQTRNRYHLSIQGEYLYHCGDEEILVEPGMLIWFNNKLKHGTKNVGEDVRITFVFDVKMR
jgi:hypothetical protein